MDPTTPNWMLAADIDILSPEGNTAAAVLPTPAGQAALAAAPATLRAYKADWTHYADWCAAHGFIPVPAAPADPAGPRHSSLAWNWPDKARWRWLEQIKNNKLWQDQRDVAPTKADT